MELVKERNVEYKKPKKYKKRILRIKFFKSGWTIIIYKKIEP